MKSASYPDHVYPCLQELLVSPYVLLQNNIPVVRCTQFPGEFVINYPGAAQQHTTPALASAVMARYSCIIFTGWSWRLTGASISTPSDCRGLPLWLQPRLQLRGIHKLCNKVVAADWGAGWVL